MNGCNMKQATATARRHGYLRTWWRDSRATGKRFFLRSAGGKSLAVLSSTGYCPLMSID